MIVYITDDQQIAQSRPTGEGVYNQQNQFAADRRNVLIYTVGCGILENGSVESDIMNWSDVNDSVISIQYVSS